MLNRRRREQGLDLKTEESPWAIAAPDAGPLPREVRAQLRVEVADACGGTASFCDRLDGRPDLLDVPVSNSRCSKESMFTQMDRGVK